VSKRLADAQAECVIVHTLGEVGTKIDVIHLTQFKSQAGPAGRQEVIALHPLQQLITSGNNSAKSTERD
jgi:hypothetical protein